MTRTEYRQARRWIRENGRTAYRWLGEDGARLQALADEQDWLAERADIIAYCAREGIHCNPRVTCAPRYLERGSAMKGDVYVLRSVGGQWLALRLAEQLSWKEWSGCFCLVDEADKGGPWNV